MSKTNKIPHIGSAIFYKNPKEHQNDSFQLIHPIKGLVTYQFDGPGAAVRILHTHAIYATWHLALEFLCDMKKIIISQAKILMHFHKKATFDINIAGQACLDKSNEKTSFRPLWKEFDEICKDVKKDVSIVVTCKMVERIILDLTPNTIKNTLVRKLVNLGKGTLTTASKDKLCILFERAYYRAPPELERTAAYASITIENFKLLSGYISWEMLEKVLLIIYG